MYIIDKFIFNFLHDMFAISYFLYIRIGFKVLKCIFTYEYKGLKKDIKYQYRAEYVENMFLTSDPGFY